MFTGQIHDERLINKNIVRVTASSDEKNGVQSSNDVASAMISRWHASNGKLHHDALLFRRWPQLRTTSNRLWIGLEDEQRTNSGPSISTRFEYIIGCAEPCQGRQEPIVVLQLWRTLQWSLNFSRIFRHPFSILRVNARVRVWNVSRFYNELL